MSTKLNYSSFDFDTIKNDMIKQLSAGVFKDYNMEGSNINQLVELFAGIGDLLNFYINMTANESYLRTADIYENINKISELIGYNPGGPKSSTTTITVSSSFMSPADDDYFIIPVTNTITSISSTSDGQAIKYTPVSQTTYVSVSGNNNFSTDLVMVQGEYITGTTFNGTGKSYQKFEIQDTQAIEEYLIVKVNGVSWTWVENIYTSSEKNIYTSRYNKNKLVELQFGNGTFGNIPTSGTNNITVDYIRTLDIHGAIGANELTKGFDNDIFLVDISNGVNITSMGKLIFTISQPNASVGHAIPLTEDDIRNYAPKAYRTQNRVVTKQDHEDLILAELNAYVQQVVTLNQNEYYDINPSAMVPETSGFNYNNIYMYILPKYGFNVNNNLKARILDFLEVHKMLTLNYIIEDINYVYVNVTIKFDRYKTSIKTIPEIENDLRTVIRDYFSKYKQKVGGTIKYSELLSNLNSVDGVSSLTMSLSANIPALSGEQLYENIDLNYTQFALVNSISADCIKDTN